MEEKGSGFIHEKMWVMPPQIEQQCRHHPMTNQLFLTDIVFFPRAKPTVVIKLLI